MPNAFLPAWFRERCFVLQQRGASAFQRLWGAADPAGSKALRTIKDTSKKTLAINQLGETGPEKLAIRLGGIYALERIARDSERDHWPIMEILTAYVREHAPWKAEGQHSQPKLAPEIQAILTVLGRRTRSYGKGEDWPLDLSFTDLRRAALTDAHLERAVLWGTHLEDAVLSFLPLRGCAPPPSLPGQSKAYKDQPEGGKSLENLSRKNILLENAPGRSHRPNI